MRPFEAFAAFLLLTGNAMAATPAEDSRALLNDARALAASGKPAEAIAKLRRWVALDPANAAAHNALGSLLNSGGHYAEALFHAEEAAKLEPANTRYRYNRGVVRAEHGRFKEAIADFDLALTANPEMTYGWLERGAAKLSLDDVAGARADWVRSRQSDPKLIWVQWYEATGDFVEGRFAEAAAGFDRVAAAEPAFVPAKLWRAITHGRAGTVVEIGEPGSVEWPAPAIRYFRKDIDEITLLTVAGKDRVSGDKRRIAEAHFFIAQRALMDGERAIARDHLRKALAISSPQHVWRIAAERDLKQLDDR